MTIATEYFLPAVAAAALLGAGGIDAQPGHATVLTSVSPAHCVAALERRDAPDPLRCPSALRTAVAEAQSTCRDAGGTLAGVIEGTVWAIDVNDDGRSELAFELGGNVSCRDAWSVFSCGSLACPKALYELRGGTWTVVGNLSASSPDHVTLGTGKSADGHRTLEVCSNDACPERWIHEWRDGRYDATRAEVRGTRIDLAESARGLHALAAATTVRATPRANGADVGRYDAGTDIAIVGTVDGGDWYYVAPCNTCDRGFVPRSAVTAR